MAERGALYCKSTADSEGDESASLGLRGVRLLYCSRLFEEH